MGSRAGHENWDEQYAGEAPPPWEIGAAQPALAALLDRIPIEQPVLDAGCGTGELAILVAERGLRVVGLDCSPRALRAARAKAAARAPDVEFVIGDAEHLQELPIRPRTVLDSGLLHNLDDDGRRAYLAGLTAICDDGAAVHVLAISEQAGPGWDLGREDLGRLFAPPHWVATAIAPSDVLARFDGEELHLPAFLLSSRRSSAS